MNFSFVDAKLTPVMTKVFQLAAKDRCDEAIQLMEENQVADPDKELEGILEFIELMAENAEKHAIQNRRW